ncbi:MAG: TonB-dependent receptor [Gammaproteobacteria bacterium]|nr:MAG: TonB-dependent receptor [Gammaproteobacteria bacterium]
MTKSDPSRTAAAAASTQTYFSHTTPQRRPLAVAIAAVVALLSAPQAINAQAHGGADTGGEAHAEPVREQRPRRAIEEVVVTASPIATVGNYQPVSFFDEDQVFQMSATSIGEMLDGQPGLAARSFGGAPARPVIRGFDGERLVVLENGERMGDIQATAPDHAVTLDPLGMNRIEVVRGPASLLYGSSALGGVINVFTEDAPRSWDVGISGGVAAHATSVNDGLAGSAALLYGSDSHAIKGSYTYRTNDDTRTPSGRLQNTQLDSYTAALGYGFQSERFRGGISVRYYENDYGAPEFAAFTDPGNPSQFIEEEPDLEIRIDRWNSQAFAIWALGGFFDELELRASWSQSLQEEGEPNPPPEDLELEIKTRTLAATMLLPHGPIGPSDVGVIGMNLHYRYQEVEGNEAYNPGEDLVNLAVFTMQEITLTDTLSLQAGVRFEHEWLKGVENRFFPPEDLLDENVFNIAAALGLSWRASDAWTLGAQLARAHRNPTVLERFADGWHAGAARVELGDSTLSSETGYGLDLFGIYSADRARLEISGFYNRIDDFVALRTLAPNCGDIEFRVQPDREFASCIQFFGADAEQYGFEVKGEMFLTENLRAVLVSDYVRGDRRDVNEPLPFMPPLRMSAGLFYESDSWRIGGRVRWVDSQTRVPDNELPTSGYTVVNLEAGYRFDTSRGHHMFNLRIDNALDKSYQDHLSVVRRFKDPILGPDNPSRFDQPGRNLVLGYRYTF